MKSKPGRHVPAFILLFLTKRPFYGLELLKEFETKLPFNVIDSAAIYRALKMLETNGFVESSWDTSESGAAKKYYSITNTGRKRLDEFKEDIKCRCKNLQFFLNEYENLKKEVR